MSQATSQQFNNIAPSPASESESASSLLRNVMEPSDGQNVEASTNDNLTTLPISGGEETLTNDTCSNVNYQPPPPTTTITSTIQSKDNNTLENIPPSIQMNINKTNNNIMLMSASNNNNQSVILSMLNRNNTSSINQNGEDNNNLQQTIITTTTSTSSPSLNNNYSLLPSSNNMISIQQQQSKTTLMSSNNNNNGMNTTLVFHNFNKQGGNDSQQVFEPQHQQRIQQQSIGNNTITTTTISEQVMINNQPLVFVEQVNQSSPMQPGQSKKKNNKPKESNIPNNFTFHNFANPQPQQPIQSSPPMMSTINLSEQQTVQQPNVTSLKKTNNTKFTNYQPSTNQSQTIQFSNYEPIKAQPSTQIVNNNNQTNATKNITHQFHVSQPPLGQFKITDYSNNYAQPLSHIDYMPSNQIMMKNSDSPNPKKRNSTGNNVEGSAAKVSKSSKSIVTSNFPTFTNSDFEGCVPSNTLSIQQQQSNSQQSSLSNKNVSAATGTTANNVANSTQQERKPATTIQIVSGTAPPVWTNNNSQPIQIVANYPSVNSAEQSPKKSNMHSASISSSSWTFHSFDQTEQPIKDQSTGLTFHSFNPKKK
ncbi:hypothetical protein NAEGRDRAFT_56957 [Naegleria gruberi]|uniref:Uncharacterized protein n=1 Tax=Naegleria gruberi TaxID=5762 RepID=D2V2W2_NAEGR|nr:uncharacterized protein NAEGRDRAFT_56957 [Naegleria gruberi]EFC49130.1 hypothetical protein NAEGRDRAFT_56957 [Naegleria gruberi]|eukprot:XP_002681874.1 hypothetical protein NAEGRDRAFT_56957 [Naegleria gruberi strain NEG-M]